MKQLSDESKKSKESIIKRLNRVEGQVRGIQKMVEEDRYCVDVLVQIAAIRSAIDKVGSIILENHVRGCVANSIKNEEQTDIMIDELMDTILKFMK